LQPDLQGSLLGGPLDVHQYRQWEAVRDGNTTSATASTPAGSNRIEYGGGLANGISASAASSGMEGASEL